MFLFNQGVSFKISSSNHFHDSPMDCVSEVLTPAANQSSMEPNHYYFPQEFDAHSSDNQETFRETCRRNILYRIKPLPRVTSTTIKKKRKRTMFTTEQIIAFEEIFHKKPYISREERIEMMNKMQLSEKSIKVWFQNRRRLTDKKSKEYMLETSSPNASDTFSDRLTLIESSINQNTDIYGYVRLDNNTMRELVNVIDEYLSQDPTSVSEETIQPVVSQSKVIYEPISPVSSAEDLEEFDVRQDFETETSQYLTDTELLSFFN